MNSLFARTLLWFVTTVVLTVMAVAIGTALDMDPEERQRGPFGALLSIQLREARYAYETGGVAALRAALQRFEATTGNQAILTDESGRDLLTGEVRRDLAREGRGRRRGPSWGRDRAVMSRRSPDGRYMLFVLLLRGSAVRWFLQPEVNLPVLGVLIGLSWAFARRLTNPVRDLRRAVESFGRGDFGVRLRSTRTDELGQLAHTFDQMADRIETLLTAERRLLLDISHELRSPLARLGVAVELARSDTDPSRHLDRIEKEAGRLNGLVGELLQVTRAEGDSAQMRLESVNLDQLVAGVVEDADLEARRRGSRVEWGKRESAEIDGDGELLRRAVENVVRNAVRYAPEGTAVEVDVVTIGTDALVTVRDCGPGVPQEHLGRIFDAFYRVEADRCRDSGGAGLGLAIARRAVELHRGTIEARNASPGLLVQIRLPGA